MPELPEVENFRQLLLPLVGDELSMELYGDHPRVKVDELIGSNSSMKNMKIVCTDILRVGKQICMVLSMSKTIKYLFLHMGMTGRIRVYGKSENWGDKKDGNIGGHSEIRLEDESSPPKYTCLIFTSPKSKYTAYFCDPRKFGSAYVADDLTDLESLAPDALTCTDQETIDRRILPALTNQRLGIKSLLLDQKRAVSGVGNWVADEVLYQCKIHPDQTKLDIDESATLYKTLHNIVSIAVKSLENDDSYPLNWLFHYRWTGKKSGKDAEGRSISFITSGGRTTAIINTLQKLYARSTPSKSLALKVSAACDEVLSSNLSPTDGVIRNSKLNRISVKNATNTKNVTNVKVFESSYFADNARKQTNETKDSRKGQSRSRQINGESSAGKRQKVTKAKGVEIEGVSRRMSPRFNASKA